MMRRLLFILALLAAVAASDALSPMPGLRDEQRALVAERACMARTVVGLGGAAGAACRATEGIVRLMAGLLKETNVGHWLSVLRKAGRYASVHKDRC